MYYIVLVLCSTTDVLCILITNTTTTITRKSKRVHRQLQQRTSNRDKNKSTGYAHGHTYQDQDLKFLQNTQKDSNSYHRTHRESLLLDRTKQPPITSAYYYKYNVFFTKNIPTKRTRYGPHYQYMHTCQIFKTSKGALLEQKGKILSNLP